MITNNFPLQVYVMLSHISRPLYTILSSRNVVCFRLNLPGMHKIGVLPSPYVFQYIFSKILLCFMFYCIFKNVYLKIISVYFFYGGKMLMPKYECPSILHLKVTCSAKIRFHSPHASFSSHVGIYSSGKM